MNAERAGHRGTSTTRFTERELIYVGHYGVHWTSDGIAFLEQGGPRGGSNALGLAVKSPFRVRIEGRFRQCNHNVPLASPNLNAVHVEQFDKVTVDALVQAMLPIPKAQGTPGVWFVDDPTDNLGLYLALLSRMSSPIRSIVQPVWTTKLNTVMEELKVTNVQPLVVTDIQPRDTETLNKLARIAPLLPRRLVLTGRRETVLPQQIMRIATGITGFELKDLMLLPWEAYGATMVRRYMRNELSDDSTHPTTQAD